MPSLLLFGDYLLSQAVSNQVPSAIRGLTSVFEMGTGVSPVLSSPYSILNKTILIGISGQMFERLVSVSSTHYCASTSDLSTGFSSRSLRNLISRGGFALRCLQRLSRPNVATRLCFWRNNRYTIGSSIPVLSY